MRLRTLPVLAAADSCRPAVITLTTMATPGARGLFGAGEAGAFPTMTRALTTWTPKSATIRPGIQR
jgi:hypothetical protein